MCLALALIYFCNVCSLGCDKKLRNPLCPKEHTDIHALIRIVSLKKYILLARLLRSCQSEIYLLPSPYISPYLAVPRDTRKPDWLMPHFLLFFFFNSEVSCEQLRICFIYSFLRSLEELLHIYNRLPIN